MKRPGALLAVAAFAAAAAALVRHAALDAAAPSFDEAWYLEVSYRLWHALRELRFADFVSGYTGAFRFKAPLISVLPLPVYALLGPSYDAAVLANLPALALLAASLYGLGRRLFSETAGGLAAALALSLPLTAALSRLVFVETWLAALTAAFLWRWVESEGPRRETEAPRLGVLLGLGLLAKATFAVPLAAPLALDLRERRPSERAVKVALGTGALIALTWYGPNLVYVAGFLASFGNIAAHYAEGPGALARYFASLGRESLGWPTAVLLCASLAMLGRRAWSDRGLRVALAWLLPPLALVGAGTSKNPRFAAAALPGAALALAGSLDLLTRGRRARSLVLGGALAACWIGFILQAAGIARAFVRSSYGGAPRPSPRADAAALASEAARMTAPGAVVVVGAEHGQLNANLLSAEAARLRLPMSFIHYGHMEERVERTVARLSEKEATHILFVDGLPEDEVPPMTRTVDAALRGLIAAERLPFRSRGAVPIGGGLRAELFERTGPIRMVGIIHR